MSTRGAVGFRHNQQDKVQYNHSDSYPDWLGKKVLQFLQNIDAKELKEIASNIVLVNESDKPTKKQIQECASFTDLNVSNQSETDWYCLLRGAQGNLEAYQDGLKYMLSAENFLLDSLFCEYAYIINTDENVLEFYSGFNKKLRKSKGRYASQQSDDESNNGYYGVVLIKKFPLEDIYKASDEEIDEIVKTMSKKASSFYNSQERELKKQKPMSYT